MEFNFKKGVFKLNSQSNFDFQLKRSGDVGWWRFK